MASDSLNRIFTIESPKPIDAEFTVEVDITKWLGDASIASATYVAKNMETGKVVTSKVTDSTKSTYTNKTIKPFIRAGNDKATYCVIATVTDDSSVSNKENFFIIFSVDDNLPKIGAI